MTRPEHALQRRLRRQARRTFEPEMLAWCCTADDFSVLGGKRTEIEEGGWRTVVPHKGKPFQYYRDDRYHIYRDNGASILGVAHLDSVQGDKRCRYGNSRFGPVVHSPALDDRLGVYVVTRLLPRMGIHLDWLLTTGEESGESTAQEFRTDKRYNWIFSFDRTGDDVVMYQYGTLENEDRLASVNATVGIGSFSDISSLDHLGVAGFNWGVGYHDYHSSKAYAFLEQTFGNVARFASFVEKYGNTRIEHVSKPKWWNSFEEDDNGDEIEYDDICAECGAPTARTRVFCDECFDFYMSDAKVSVRKALGMTEGEWQQMQEETA